MAGYKMTADMGGGGTKLKKPNPGRAAALKDAIKVNVDKGGSALKGVRGKSKLDTPSPVLAATEVRDTKRKDALGAALRKIKNPYIYTSGNLRNRIGMKRSKFEEA